MNPEVSISLDRVSKRFGKTEVLHDISLEMRPSEIFGLLGPSGSGKTTLVKLIAGIDAATHGEIRVKGVKMPSLDMFHRIGYMAQSDALYLELTARENLEFFALLYGLRGRQRKQRMEEVMALVNLSEHVNKPVALYSGGMKRRLSLAIALLHRPDILILDEPTVGIDPVLRKSIWAELRELAAQGTTVLVTTHVMDEAEKCDRLCMIREGRNIAVGTPQALKEQIGVHDIEEAFLFYGGANA
jgi:ABC-2 type transport system ATP-binding protein